MAQYSGLEQFGTEPFPIAIPHVPVAPADAATDHPNQCVFFVNFRNLHLPNLNTPANAIKLRSTHRLYRPFCRCSEHCSLPWFKMVLALTTCFGISKTPGTSMSRGVGRNASVKAL